MRLRILEHSGPGPFKDRGVCELTTRPVKGEMLAIQEEKDGPRVLYRVLDVVHNIAHPDGPYSPDTLQIIVGQVLTDCQLAKHVSLALCNGQRPQQSLF